MTTRHQARPERPIMNRYAVLTISYRANPGVVVFDTNLNEPDLLQALRQAAAQLQQELDADGYEWLDWADVLSGGLEDHLPAGTTLAQLDGVIVLSATARATAQT